MVDMVIAAAALAAATSQEADAALVAKAQAKDPGESVRSAVPVERRRVARVTTGSSADFASLKPLLERAKVDASLTETRTLLDRAESQLEKGNREQAMLTLDGASLQLERSRPDATGNFTDVFRELELRESALREKLGQPSFVPLRSAPPAPKKDGEPGDATKDDGGEPVKPVLRDELPVG